MNEIAYVRGGFIVYDRGGYPNNKRVIPFRFNPESLTRTVQVETGQSGGGVQGAQQRSSSGGAGAAAAPAAEAGADQATGTIKQTFSVVIRLDFADRQESLTGFKEEEGIAPEIAAIEDLLHPAAVKSDAASDGSDPVRVGSARPTVLFVWGLNRVLPVRITALKIEETVFNNLLNPVRAEIEASLEVLGAAEALADDAVKAALGHADQERQRLAESFHERTASQSSNALQL
jgi:hypothetical protein